MLMDWSCVLVIGADGQEGAKTLEAFWGWMMFSLLFDLLFLEQHRNGLNILLP